MFVCVEGGVMGVDQWQRQQPCMCVPCRPTKQAEASLCVSVAASATPSCGHVRIRAVPPPKHPPPPSHTHLEAWLSRECSPVVVDVAVIVQDVDELQGVALAHIEVVGVVCGGDLDST